MSTQNGRFQGNFTLDPAMFGGASASADSTQQTPPSGAPSAPPAQPQDPFNNQPAGQPEAQQQPRHLLRKIVGGALVIIGIVAIIVVATKLWPKGESGDSSNPGASTSQTSQNNQSGQTSDTPDNTQSPDNGTITERTAAQQAALLDSWFSGIPESNWETKTAADLGGSADVPLGNFCASFTDYVVVLQDGTVITRGNAENGDKIAIVISDYTVPTEWHNMAVGLDKQKLNLVLVVSVAPTNGASVNGSIWQWDNGTGGYVYVGSGEASAYE